MPRVVHPEHERRPARPRASAPRGSVRGGRARLRAARLAVVAALTVPAVLGAGSFAPAPAAAGQPPPGRADQPFLVHGPPVDAPIVDPFRPPAGPYGAGNRGLEYDTTPGDPVRASAAGTVVFAGPVAGSHHVTLEHGDGVRTSYSFLHTIDVASGARLGAGDVVGTAGERLHFGARIDGAYFDPAMLFGGAPAVELLPYEVPPGSTPLTEVRLLSALAVGEGGPSVGDRVGPALRWLRERATGGFEVLRPALDLATGVPLRFGLGVAGDLVDRLVDPPTCSDLPPPHRPAETPGGPGRVAVTVAGLGSSSDSAAIDDLRATDLGYDGDRVVRFSYRGGRTPGSGAAVDGPAGTPYTSADTQGDAEVAGRRLADLIEQIAAAEPGVPIDVYAHSLGGLVTRLSLAELDRRGFDFARLGFVVTIASPHDGADLATAVAWAADAPVAGLALDGVAGALGLGLDPDAPVVAQLAEGSPLVRGLADIGVPDGVGLLSIGARGDLVVPALRTEVTGATNVTVPTAGVHAHSEVVGAEATTAAIARALAGRPPACEAWHDVVADVVTGHAIVTAEDHLGLGLAAAG